ncbi:MAG TPA: choice-of-anchor P family protein [Terriglobales bacterium]|nr:choice-of-anchor P family protein [Terriglobales bacterium]
MGFAALASDYGCAGTDDHLDAHQRLRHQSGYANLSGHCLRTYAFVGNTLLVGQTAPITLAGPCGTSQQPLNVMGSAAGVNLPPLVTGGAVNTDVSSASQQAQALADTASISLLGGLITAQEIKAVSTTTIDSNGVFHVSAGGSTVNNLVILGHVYNGSVPANMRINIPLLGYVVLNEQLANIGSSEATLTVNMLHVHVTTINILGLQVGTEVIVSNATSGMVNVFAPGIISGESYGTQVMGPLLASAPTAPESLPCFGTNGQVLTNSLASLNLPSILTSGTVTNTVESNLTISLSTGQNTSTVQGLNLLNGLVTASVMRAQVVAAVNNSNNYILNGSDSFAGISVAGHPEITDSVPYNTNVSLAGLGTLYLKRVIHNAPYPHFVEVRSLELVVTQNNSYNLPIGLDVIVGDTQIQIIPASNP